ncbi:MAG: hypothetical protein AAF928_01075 [Myxococcota bacterium]
MTGARARPERARDGRADAVGAPIVEDGRDGLPIWLTLSRVALAAGGLLLLPRQVVSAGIAFALGLVLRGIHHRRSRGAGVGAT